MRCCHQRSNRFLIGRTAAFSPIAATRQSSRSQFGWIFALAATVTTTTSRPFATCVVEGWSASRRSSSNNKTVKVQELFASSPFDPLYPYNSLTTARFMSSGSDEVERAKAAAAAAPVDDNGPPTIFDKIVAGQIPCNKLYEDEQCLAFYDVNPQAPTHFLVIPKQRQGLTQLSKMQESQKELVGHLLFVAQKLAHERCPKGFRLTVNDGPDGAQSVYHLHIHVMGGRQMSWPPG